MWKAPGRPAHKVSQDYNDGFVQIYAVADEAEPGYAPRPRYSLRVGLPYAERRVGLQRYYEAKQAQTRVERLIRVPDCGLVSNLDHAITEDLKEYRIDLVQTVPDVYPPSLDLTLVAFRQGREAAGDG